MKRRRCFNSVNLLAVTAIGILLAAMPPAAGETVIAIDASQTLGPVNRLVFGHNIEAADGRDIFCKEGQGFWNPAARKSNPEMVKAVRALGIGMLRWPGGCYAHWYDWRQYVGPLSDRGNRHFGLDEYLTLCHDLGAEPMITISDYVLPANEMPAHAAALVEYLNSPATSEHPWAMKRKEWGRPQPYGVTWFELGNESDHGNHGAQWGFQVRRFAPEEYVAYAVATAAAMRRVDPAIKIGVVARPSSGNDYDCGWNLAIYRGAVPVADFLTVHFYGPSLNGSSPEDFFKMNMAHADRLREWIANYRAGCRRLGGKELPLAVTEYNAWNVKEDPLPYRFTAMAGLYCADQMRLFLEPSNHIATAEYWQVANGYWGMLATQGGRIVQRRATLPFFQLWGTHFNGRLLKTEVTGAPRFASPCRAGLFPAEGDILANSNKVTDMVLPPFQFAATDTARARCDRSGVISFKTDGLATESYPEFALFKRPPEASDNGVWLYRLRCKARFLTALPAARENISLGIGLCDLRGYDKVKSGTGVMGMQKAGDWQVFSCVFQARPDFPGARVLLKIEDGAIPFHGKIHHPVPGTLEIRDVTVELYRPLPDLAYQGLTATAALAADGQTLHVVVLNKSYDQEIRAAVMLKGFAASTVEAWTAGQGDVFATDYAVPLHEGVVPLPAGPPWGRRFPAHSMTVLDIKR